MLIFIFLIVVIICLIRINKNRNKNMLNKSKLDYNHSTVKVNLRMPFGDVSISNKDQNIDSSEGKNGDLEQLLDMTNEDREKMIKGDVKITTNVNRKVTKYVNGEKVSEEETISTDNIDKKAINKCLNCGASIDLGQEECSYCGTKIN